MKNHFKTNSMKYLIVLLTIPFLFACNTSSKKETNNNSTSKLEGKPVEQSESENMDSADYTSLLSHFKCEMDISEIANVLKVPETSLSLSNNSRQNECAFNLNGFGQNTLGEGSKISWGTAPSSKKQNKKEIRSYLERKEKELKIMGMDIELADTGDCYLAYQPAHGRIIIYNENYDDAFLLHYGFRSANTDRTTEQHEELRLKMTDLANYLLQKHRK
tara:strand:- start:2112 stop:2765 length:654 start_codon:yes stop_codon:yes gene_type:complete